MKPTKKQLRHALAVLSGRITSPGLGYCKILGFTERDWRTLSVLGDPQPPLKDEIKKRCEEIELGAILNGVEDA